MMRTEEGRMDGTDKCIDALFSIGCVCISSFLVIITPYIIIEVK